MLFNWSLTLVLGFVASALGLGQKATIAFDRSDGCLELATDGQAPTIIVDSSDWAGVIRAAHDLATDFGRVTGQNGSVQLVNGSATGQTVSAAGPVIMVGTIGNSSLLANLMKAGKVNVDQTEGQWEAFQSQLVANPMQGVERALVVSGADKRGSIYGIYDISEQIGVSPWYYYADVPAKHHDTIYAMEVKKIQASPSVKYRGIFLNDEQPALTNWVNENYKPGKYGPGFNHNMYAPIFELLLRLRANYIWPAEWNSMFAVDDPKSPPEADMYGIVVGSSHTEPMMRWTKEQSLFLDGIWAWQSNEKNITKFMLEGAERSKPYESLYTMGMRGLGDTASPTLDAPTLEEIIAVEQDLLRETFGRNDISDIPQMWCLYKEVGGYFEQGMKVPGDITLLWADDNWGNNQRLPLSNETDRAAGAGVYYHFDYVGDPRDYKWINTIQLQKTWEQMHFAYERDARTIWVVNVGDLKPLEVPINHFMDLAYDEPSMSGPDSTSTWLQNWAAREFGADVSSAAASVMNTYGQLAARRKYELLDPTIYSNVNYNETARVLDEWASLVSDAQAVYHKLDSDTQAAFFELVLHPCMAGHVVHLIYLTGGMQNTYAYEWRQSANALAQDVLEYFGQDAALTKRYHSLLNGKWNHILDQTHIGYNWWQQPMRNVLPALNYLQPSEVSLGGSLGVTAEGMNGSAPGDSIYNIANSDSIQVMPPIDPYGPSSRYIDVYMMGPGSASFQVTPTETYITASPSSGTLDANGQSDQRIYFSVDWSAAPRSTVVPINITNSNDNYGSFNMPLAWLPVNNTKAPDSFHGFVESDGHVSIEAEHTVSNTSSSDVSYSIIPGYGRTLSGVTLGPVTADSQTAPASPRLTYSFYAFTHAPMGNVTVYTGTSLNTIPSRPLQYAVAVDDDTPKTIQPVPDYTLGVLPEMWYAGVANAVFTNTTNVTITPGAHKLHLWALEPGVIFQKILIDMGGVRPSYLGPPESMQI